MLFKGKPFKFQRPFGSYVMENVLFKISFPAEFHSQTAVECAMTIFQQLKLLGKTAEDIKKITIRTHEAAIRIIDKKGPLNNPADRDHCIQYMVAVPLLFGRLTAADYEDDVAADPRIDELRDKIVCVEDKQFTRDYHDPKKRSIANALTVEFKDGTQAEGSGRANTRSATSAAARKACRCWWRSSRPTSRAASRRSSRRRSSSCAWTRSACRTRRSTSSSTCSSA